MRANGSRLRPDGGGSDNSAGGSRFATTRWSVVTAAAAGGENASEHGREALEVLCRSYWYPLYAFIRRRGYDADKSMDLTQAFFTTVLEKNYLADAERSRGRFRTFLLTSAKHFLCNEADREGRLKRGGGQKFVSLDVDANDADARYRLEPADGSTPEHLFDRRWALVLLGQVLEQVRADYEAEGNGAVFQALRGVLTCEPDADSYATLAPSVGLSKGAARVAVHRLRKRYRQRLRAAIADSVASEADVDEEIRDLFAALAPPRD